MNLNRFSPDLANLDTFHLFDDFWQDQSDINAIDTVTDSGTVVIGDAAAGLVTLTPSDGSVADNDEAYLATPNELWIFAVGKPIYGRCRLKFTEVTATKLNVAFGFQNAVGANSLVDDGGGPKVSGSTLCIYKVDGGAVWRCASACNGTSTDSVSTTAAVAATWYELEIICGDWDGVSMQVSFKVDGQYLRDSNNAIIRHTVAIASATEMALFLGAKLGAATNNDTVIADYWYGAQAR